MCCVSIIRIVKLHITQNKNIFGKIRRHVVQISEDCFKVRVGTVTERFHYRHICDIGEVFIFSQLHNPRIIREDNEVIWEVI